MSDSLSSSPSSPLRRAHNGPAHFPWLTRERTHSGSSSQHTINANASSSRAVPQPANALPWDSASSPGYIQSGRSHRNTNTNPLEDTTRHWTFTAFEWIVHDVCKLKDFIESAPSLDDNVYDAAAEEFKILKESPLLDGKFKLEIDGNSDVVERGLSLLVTSLTLDFSHGRSLETEASMMAAIKAQDDRIGERGARCQWIWEHWQEDWIFRREFEVWECHLPSLSSLLENDRVRQTNSFVICIQIGPFFPQQPSAHYVPRSLLEGLEASLDNANTGDVRFVCLERLLQPHTSGDVSPNQLGTTPRSPGSVSSSSSRSVFSSSRTTARKRVVYAHSDILTRRSDYFRTMLESSFAEASAGSQDAGDRKQYTIIVEEADFETIYWLLKWVYGNWLLFKVAEDDDPRASIDGVGAGWSVRWLNARGLEWDWKTFRKNSGSEDAPSIASTRSRRSSQGSPEHRREDPVQPRQTFDYSATPTLSSMRSRLTDAQSSNAKAPSVTTVNATTQRNLPSTSVNARQSSSVAGSRIQASQIASPSLSVSRTKPVTVPAGVNSFTTSASTSNYPGKSRAPRQHLNARVPDPHPHPTPAPAPASALSMYQVAHRYSIPGLADLALEHIMSTITPQASTALLLASSMWEDLRLLIEDYIVEHWDDVSMSSQFEQCCAEVAAGEWGAEGGRRLTGLFRRLRSPSAVSFARE